MSQRRHCRHPGAQRLELAVPAYFSLLPVNILALGFPHGSLHYWRFLIDVRAL
jgi:hypothetical protein